MGKLCQEKTNLINAEFQRKLIRCLNVTLNKKLQVPWFMCQSQLREQTLLHSSYLFQTTVCLYMFYKSVNYFLVCNIWVVLHKFMTMFSSYCAWKCLLLQCIMWNSKYFNQQTCITVQHTLDQGFRECGPWASDIWKIS